MSHRYTFPLLSLNIANIQQMEIEKLCNYLDLHYCHELEQMETFYQPATGNTYIHTQTKIIHPYLMFILQLRSVYEQVKSGVR